MDKKKELLHTIYRVYSSWVEQFSLACQKGCAFCCTQSVTMTTLEGKEILDFVRIKGREEWLIEKFFQDVPGKSNPAMTTNQFAKACLKHQEVNDDALGNWDFAPCIFLDDNICSIYEVRPFGCRSFGSFVQCAAGKAAEMAPIHLTVNTVFTQVIEQISSDGGHWSAMTDILKSLVSDKALNRNVHLLPAQPVPGFLLEPEEVQTVQVLLKQLCGQSSEMGTCGDLIDNFMLI